MGNEGRDEILDTLGELRQGALLLSMAHAYLSEPWFLKKIGREMILAMSRLPGEIESIRRQYPGRFEKEVDTGPLLDELGQMLKRTQAPGEELLASCARGEFGLQLARAVKSLSSAVMEIRGRVEGRPAYTRRDAASLRLSRGAGLISGVSQKLFRSLLILVLAAAALFVVLLLTMEKEGAVLDEIAAMEVRVQSSRLLLAEIRKERDQASRELGSVKAKELSGPEKIELLERNQRLLQIAQRERDAEADLVLLEKGVESRRAKLDELRRKSFVARLLRL